MTTSFPRAFRKISSRLRTLISWLHHFLRYARCSVSHPLLRTPPARLRLPPVKLMLCRAAVFSVTGTRLKQPLETVLGVRQPIVRGAHRPQMGRHAPSVLRHQCGAPIVDRWVATERLPQGVLRKGFARDQSLLYFAERYKALSCPISPLHRPIRPFVAPCFENRLRAGRLFLSHKERSEP
jgi:hypothetical protein